MAKNKDNEIIYKEEGLKRIKERKRKRLQKFITNVTEHKNSRCSWCGGEKRWCSSCDMWTRTCCEEYGTCMCS
jgi:hypothetical protein